MSTHASHFTAGFRVPMRGYQFLREHQHLWRYVIAPVLVNILITLLVLGTLVAAGLWFAGSIHPWVLTQLVEWGPWVAWSASIALGVAFLLVCLAAAVLSSKLFGGILCGYLYGKLAEQVEATLGIAPNQLQSISFRYELFDTSYRLVLLVLVQLFFFGVGLFPLVGGPIALAGNLTCTFLVNGMDYLDIPLALRGHRFVQRRNFGLRHKAHTAGLGAAVFLFGLIPLVGSVLATTAVVGAVLLHRDLEAKEAAVSEAVT